MPSRFDRGFERPTLLCEFRSSFSHHRAEEHRLSVATNLLQETEMDENFMEGIIIGDKTCIYGSDPGTIRQSSHWKSPDSPRPNKARKVLSKVKLMLIGKGLLVMSTSQKVKQCINITILRFLGD
jgi:hypothetical protein